jgi:ribose 5-phosphate isomerase B
VQIREACCGTDKKKRGLFMKIAISSDHGGNILRKEIVNLLNELGMEYQDFGPHTDDSVDYPDYAKPVAERVASGEFDRGILICGTGIGMSIAANKVKGIRCALVHDVFSAKATRGHNNSNILAMGERVIGPGLAREIARTWLSEEFEGGGRHERRIEKVAELEN